MSQESLHLEQYSVCLKFSRRVKTHKIAKSENVNEAKDRRVIVDHSDFPLSRAHMRCRSHVPSIPEKSPKAPYEGPRRIPSRKREILRDGFTERARWIFAIPNPFHRIEGQAMVRDVCNSISIVMDRSLSQNDFLRSSSCGSSVSDSRRLKDVP